jgi:hypothetical protein
MRKEVPDRGGRQVRVRWDQAECAKVVVCRRVQIHQPLLPQLHHGDCGVGLGNRSDAKDRVFRDRRLRRNIGEAVTAKPRDASVSYHRDGQAGARPAVEDLNDRRLQVEVIDPTVRVHSCD